MQTTLADQHRSHLEALLAVEIEFKHRAQTLANRRISEIKKLLATTDELYPGANEEDPFKALGINLPSNLSVAEPEPVITKGYKKKKKKHKKSATPAKPVKIAVGKAPRLIDAIQMVMRNKKMKAQQIHEHLRNKGWLPNSKDPIGYIRFTLSSEGNIFQRLDGERGVYQLDPSNPYYNGKLGAKSTSKRSVQEPIEDDLAPPSEEVQEVAAPDEPPHTDSEPSHGVSEEESHKLVQMMIEGNIPVD